MSKKEFHIFFTIEQFEQLKKIGKQSGQTISAIVRQLVIDYLKEVEKNDLQ